MLLKSFEKQEKACRFEDFVIIISRSRFKVLAVYQYFVKVMATIDDWYPREPFELAEFYTVLAENLPQVAEHFEIDEETVERVQKNAVWLAYWTQLRAEWELKGKVITSYYNSVAWGKGGGGEATAPNLKMPAPPEDVPIGIDAFTRRLRRRILSHPNYTELEGSRLGLTKKSSKSAASSERMQAELTANFTSERLNASTLRVKFARQGMTALRLEIKRKGADWEFCDFFTNSPALLEITPREPGTVEEVEFRAFLVRKNKIVGKPAHQTVIIGGAL